MREISSEGWWRIWCHNVLSVITSLQVWEKTEFVNYPEKEIINTITVRGIRFHGSELLRFPAEGCTGYSHWSALWSLITLINSIFQLGLFTVIKDILPRLRTMLHYIIFTFQHCELSLTVASDLLVSILFPSTEQEQNKCLLREKERRTSHPICKWRNEEGD